MNIRKEFIEELKANSVNFDSDFANYIDDTFEDVLNAAQKVFDKKCNIGDVVRCTLCKSTKISDSPKKQIEIDGEWRYIYADVCDDCGAVLDVHFFD